MFSKSSIFSQIYFSLFLNGIDQYSQFSSNFIAVSPPDRTLPNVFYFGKISTDSSFSGNVIDLYTGRGARVMISPSSLQYCQLSIGIQQPFCLYCYSVAYIYNGTCVLSCPSGSYRDINTMTCRICNDLCKECSGPQESACLSCATPYPYLFNSRCFDYCPIGTLASANYTCICHQSCQTCAYDSTSASFLCQTCMNPSHFIRNGYECVESLFCPYDYFGSTAATSSCALTCAANTYKNYGNRKCSGYCTTDSLKYENGAIFSCFKECPESYYNSTITAIAGFQTDQTIYQCTSCTSPCLTCDQNKCLTCITDYLYHENNGTCNTSCMNGFIQEGSLCRVCRENCSICPYNFSLFNSSCLETCPIGTTKTNLICEINNAPLVTILNKTNSNILTILRKNDLVLVVDYIYLSGIIDSISWSLNGLSSVYSTEFFTSTYKQLKTLTIPKANLRGNVQYNISVSIYAKGIKGEDFILIKTYPDIDVGVFFVTPSSGVSGLDNFTLSLLLWNNSQNLSFSVISFNQIVVNLSQNQTIYGRYSPDKIFTNLTSNGNYSFKTAPRKESSNFTIELIVSNFDTELKKNLTISLLPYNGNLTELENDLWRLNYSAITSLEQIYEKAYSLNLVFGITYSSIYQRENEFSVYKAAKLLNNNTKFYCDDLIHCYGHGVCQQNPLNSKSYSCKCFTGYAGENCYRNSRDYQLLINYTMTLILNLKSVNISTIAPLTFLKCVKIFLDLFDLFPKNAIVLSIMYMNNILTLPNLSIESLTLIIENLGLLNYHLKRNSLRLDERIKYTNQIINILDDCLNLTESLIILGQDYFFSSEYLDIYIAKKPRFSFISSPLVFNGSLIIPLSKIQVYIPVEAFSVEDIVILRTIQWKTSFQDFDLDDNDISLKGQIEFKFAGKKTQIQNLTKPVLIYLAKIAIYDAISDVGDKIIPYTCGYYNESLSEFSRDGCQYMNESTNFILCNCTHFSTFSAEIFPGNNITYPPSLETLIADNNIDNSNFSLTNLLSVDFSKNLMTSRYVERIKVFSKFFKFIFFLLKF